MPKQPPHGSNGSNRSNRSNRSNGSNGTVIGKPFPPGRNSHEPGVYRRGPDRIPRGIKLLYAVVSLDEREAIYQEMCKISRGDYGPAATLKFLELAGDRLEGKPTQHIVADHRRSTTFTLDAQAEPVSADEAQAAVPAESSSAPVPTADLAALPPGSLTVLPPPQ